MFLLIACAVFHIPFTRRNAPFRMRMLPCGVCKSRFVPEILLSTVEPHSQGGEPFPILGTGQLIEARVCRAKPRGQGEAEATLVSEAIPFLEYDLHRQVSLRCVFSSDSFRSLFSSLSVGVQASCDGHERSLQMSPLCDCW